MSISEQVHESVDEPVSKSSTSLPSALTEHHNSTPYEGPFTLKTTTTSTYISHSDAEGLSSDEVGQLLASDRTPWGMTGWSFHSLLAGFYQRHLSRGVNCKAMAPNGHTYGRPHSK